MKKKPVTCPHCGRRVFDAKKNVNVKTKVMTLYKKSVNKESWEPDFYIKCWKCQSIVGYMFFASTFCRMLQVKNTECCIMENP